VNSPQPSHEPLPQPEHRRVFAAPVQELAAYALILGVVLLALALLANPWERPWRSLDEITAAADDFVMKQGRLPEYHTLAHTVRYRPDGFWSERMDSAGFAMRPALAYRIDLYRRGWDTWTLELNRDGRVIRLLHRTRDDAPGAQLRWTNVQEVLQREMEVTLALPAEELTLVSDSLITRPQRNDYLFEYQWPKALGEHERLRVVLAGEHLGALAVVSDTVLTTGGIWPWGEGGEFWQRSVGVLLIFFGCAVILIVRRGPMAWRPGVLFGGLALALVVIERVLRVHFYEISIPVGVSLDTYVVRTVLGSVIDAAQVAIVVVLAVATGEALSRDRLPEVATLTRFSPAQPREAAAWVSAARAALPWAILILIVEAVLAWRTTPVGFMRVAAEQLSYALSSPVPILTVLVQTILHALWHEGIFRLWALIVLISLLRNRVAAIVISAALATLFGTAGALDWPLALWFIWAIIAAGLVTQAGIRAAFLLHVLVLGSHTALLLVWTGLVEGGWSGGVVAGLLLLGLLSIGIWAESARRLAS